MKGNGGVGLLTASIKWNEGQIKTERIITPFQTADKLSVLQFVAKSKENAIMPAQVGIQKF